MTEPNTSVAVVGQDDDFPSTAGDWILWSSIAIGVLWAAGVGAFLIGFHGTAQIVQGSPSLLAGTAFIMIAPAGAFGLLGFAAREMIRFAAASRRLEYASLRLSAPLDTAREGARSLTEAISQQIDLLNRAAEGSLARLAAMEEVLRHHADSVQAASGDARDEVDALIENMGRERAAITELADTLRGQATNISEVIDRQAEMIAKAAETAAGQAEDNRAILDKSADKLAAAGGAAQQAGERVAIAIDEQLRDMDALVGALDHRAERLEQVAALHSENVKVAHSTSQELSLAADAGAEAMRKAVDSAIEQARRFASVVEEEARRAAEVGAAEVDRVRRAAQSAHEASADAGRILESNVQGLVDRVEELNALSLNAATSTTEAFDSRIRAVETAIAEVDERIAELPRTAEARAAQLSRALEDGLRTLEQAAHRGGFSNGAGSGTPATATYERRDEPAERYNGPTPGRYDDTPRRAADGRGGRRDDIYRETRYDTARGDHFDEDFPVALSEERVGGFDGRHDYDGDRIYDVALEVDAAASRRG
ncbi:MAG: hypothetical protein MI723_16340, partial [Caulobacterales bacterium]|nr:hypothetical protein [Caulobacterales bacterium]